MRRRVWITATLGGLAAMAVGTVRGTTVTLPKPLAAEVYVKAADGPATPLRGSLIKYDDDGFTLHVGTADKTLAWTDVTPVTAYALRQKTTDRTKADQELALGQFGWSIGLKDQATATLKMAVRLDASLKPQVDDILASPSGAALTAAATTQADKAGSKELIKTGDAPPPAHFVPSGGAADAGDGTVKFHTATPEEAATAMAAAHKEADHVEKLIGVKFHSFETDHFLIFTDWDVRENDFLKENLEGAYRVVAKQFDANPKDNVFIGKLPVFMLLEYRDFATFARDIDAFPKVTQTLAGYFKGNSAGIGHMAMWKPTAALTGNSSLDDARRLWARVLVHEFTHAFLHRYRSNVFVTRWLNEGIAEVIASGQFPDNFRRRMARTIATDGRKLGMLFHDEYFPSGEYYPVMQSMVEMLIASNKSNFLKYVNAIKDGTPPEDALKAIYKVDYEQFADEWRKWAKTRPDNG